MINVRLPLPKWVGLKSDLTELPKWWTGKGAVLGLVKDLEGRQVYSVIILALVWLQMVKSICFSILIAISFSYLLALCVCTGCTFGPISQYICPHCVALITFQRAVRLTCHVNVKCSNSGPPALSYIMWASPHGGYPKSKYSPKRCRSDCSLILVSCSPILYHLSTSLAHNCIHFWHNLLFQITYIIIFLFDTQSSVHWLHFPIVRDS